jgi:multidrug efflux pump subunit AcrA (membrane-fusion protein)
MRKYLTIGLGLLVLAGGFWASTLFKAPAAGPGGPKKPALSKPAVFAKPARPGKVPIVVTSTGPLRAQQRMELFAEVQGILLPPAKPFKPGVSYGAQEVFFRLDDAELQATLQAQKSTLYNLVANLLPDLRIDFPQSFPAWEQYAKGFDPAKPLPPMPEPASDQEKVFLATRNLYTTYHNIKAQEERLRKYTLRAPFAGTLASALVTPGTLVRAGQQLGTFVGTQAYELEVAVRQTLLPFLRVGGQVAVQAVGQPGRTWKGTVLRLNPTIDQSTQTGVVYLLVQGAGLAEGMYMEAVIEAREESDACEIPRNLLVNETQVYVVRDSSLHLAEVEPVYFNEATVVVKGLAAGTLLLAKPIPGAFEGMPVTVYEEKP